MKSVFFLLMTTIFVIGCDKEEDIDLNLLSIDLIINDNPTFFAKTVILFENSDYLIKTNFVTYIDSYPFDVLYGYDEIKEQATQASNNHEVIMMTDYLYQSKDSTYILAYHLEHGSCLIFDKKNNKIIPTIEMEEWGDFHAPLAGAGGRRFFIKNKLFLETVDLIS